MVLCIAQQLCFPYLYNMKIENTKAQMRKGVLELCILSLLSEGEMYPSDIIEKLKEQELKRLMKKMGQKKTPTMMYQMGEGKEGERSEDAKPW